ncbi:hypothetical protein [Thermoactinomyces sp. CICC 23799]|nr:hypothetical protein [Thermoactinomyces sp. CICC 23799]
MQNEEHKENPKQEKKILFTIVSSAFLIALLILIFAISITS